MTTSTIDLTTVADVRQWLGLNASAAAATTSDDQIQKLITAASQVILNWLDRPTLTGVQAFDEWYDVGIQPWLLLRQWPVVSVTSIQFGSTIVTQQATGAPPANGYMVTPDAPSGAGGGQARLTMFGYRWCPGRMGVRVQYSAGYSVVPFDVSQACVEMVGEKFKMKDRIGVRSKSIANGENIVFTQSDMTPSVRMALQNYQRVVPG